MSIKHIYPHIKDLRNERRMSQTEMSVILDCSQRVYSDYERGILDIPSRILIKLADYHNVSADYILGHTDNKKSG